MSRPCTHGTSSSLDPIRTGSLLALASGEMMSEGGEGPSTLGQASLELVTITHASAQYNADLSPSLPIS